MKTATIIYRWTAKTSSRCLGRYYTASTLLEAIKAGKEFVAREFHGTGSILIEASLDGGKTWYVSRECRRDRDTQMLWTAEVFYV